MKHDASRTAASALAAIEAYSRRTFAATVVGVVILAMIAVGLGVVGWDYWTLKRSMAEASRAFGDRPARPARLTTGPPGTMRP